MSWQSRYRERAWRTPGNPLVYLAHLQPWPQMGCDRAGLQHPVLGQSIEAFRQDARTPECTACLALTGPSIHLSGPTSIWTREPRSPPRRTKTVNAVNQKPAFRSSELGFRPPQAPSNKSSDDSDRASPHPAPRGVAALALPRAAADPRDGLKPKAV